MTNLARLFLLLIFAVRMCFTHDAIETTEEFLLSSKQSPFKFLALPMSEYKRKSLMAEFDELCRYSSILTSDSHKEFLSFATHQEECRIRWLQAEMELERINLKLNKEKIDRLTLETKLNVCRRTLSNEIGLRKRAVADKNLLESQLSLIKEILLESNAVNDQTRVKLAFLNNATLIGSPTQTVNPSDDSVGSILSPSDYDLTEEDLDSPSMTTRNRGKRKTKPSAPPLSDDTPPKKSKANEIVVTEKQSEIIATTTITLPRDGRPVTASAVIEKLLNKRRSNSEPTCMTQTPEVPRRVHIKSEGNDEDEIFDESLMDAPQLEAIPTNKVKSRRSMDVVTRREHDFVSKTIIKPEKCISCDRKVKFGKLALKCKECRVTCHVECKYEISIPCTPMSGTPGSKGLVGCAVSDFAPKLAPFIPPLVLHCIMEVELRGLNEIGLYRVPGSEKELKEIKDKFVNGKTIPKLSKADIHAVAGCVKDFLRSLKEPLVTYDLWQDFVEIAAITDVGHSLKLLKILIEKLPIANRDTLSYLIMHLQLVSKTPECKMPSANLARVFGPTIVGYSSAEPEPALMLRETKQQVQVIERFLRVDQDYWAKFISVDVPGTPATPDTPELTPGKRGKIGSSSSSSLKLKARKFLGHTPLSSRESKTSLFNKRPQKYFASPMLQ